MLHITSETGDKDKLTLSYSILHLQKFFDKYTSQIVTFRTN